MALLKPWIVRYLDADGRRVPKGTPGARRVRQRAKKWYAEYSVNGRPRRVPLCRDKQAARAMYCELLKRAERPDAFEEHRKRPLTEHLADFERFLEARGNTAKHARQTCHRVQAVVDGCRFVYLAGVLPSAVVEWLAEERRAKRLSIRTSNYYLRDAKAFCRWLVKDGRTDANPLAHLSPLNADPDEHLERRILPPDEFAAFLEAARAGGTVRSLCGLDRATLYIVAAYTGFRASELASLTPESFDLNADPRTVTVEASYSKRRRRDTQPLRSDLATLLRDWLAAKPAGERLWPGGWWRHAAKMVRKDLAAASAAMKQADPESAGIPFRDEAGCVFDFHALRHQFISSLAAAGIHPKLAQTLARHSTITLTLDRYTHVALFDQSAALDKLPAWPIPRPGRPERERLQATGTENLVAGMVAGPDCISTHSAASGRTGTSAAGEKATCQKTLEIRPFRIDLHSPASASIGEAPPGFEPGMADLQSAALPLG